jgi:hypothetical protein
VLEIVPPGESSETKVVREAKRAWLSARNYKIVEINSQERELEVLLARIEEAMKVTSPTQT